MEDEYMINITPGIKMLFTFNDVYMDDIYRFPYTETPQSEGFCMHKPTSAVVSVNRNPQSKVKKTKEKKNKKEKSISAHPHIGDAPVSHRHKTRKERIRKRFNRFWKAYPKKRSKGQAEKA